ncbi:MAG TPA: energy-coupling factor transporter transmembrane protein EcfT [Clostridiaceae bacterium]|nr:energy-coupling factor transporter transmembrane protein EcfT [Clostridiaceae bacterium]
MEDAFAKCHPIINFIFFIGAIIMGMIFVHPLFLLISILTSALYYLLLVGKYGWKFLFFILVAFLALSVLNPIINTRGDTVLFTYLNNRRFTLEALLYGIATAGMFVSVLLWFACYNRIMTSDKFIYLFGSYVPALSLILSMVLRLVPNFKMKTATIIGARRCVGKYPKSSIQKEKIQHSIEVLNVLTSWALEGAVITADSMKSRGYGSGERSRYSSYRLNKSDAITFVSMLLGLILVICGALAGGTHFSFYPISVRFKASWYTIISVIGYIIFLLTPSAIHIKESITWHILRSRI